MLNILQGGGVIELDEGLKILNEEALEKYMPHLEYFKYWLSIRHLIWRKNMTFEEILNTELNLNEVLEEAKRAEYKVSAIQESKKDKGLGTLGTKPVPKIAKNT